MAVVISAGAWKVVLRQAHLGLAEPVEKQVAYDASRDGGQVIIARRGLSPS